ncbi:glycosyltransferase family 2 protein [Patescibacteria group bacterium]|nr:glycosyltransferase family 2 protein [Patescibacteria group bacterium]
MVKISIIIANHQANKLFFNTLASVINSWVSYSEVIVVNNGLNLENTSKIKLWQKQHKSPLIKFLNLEEGNPSLARNMGAKKAKGRYLLFLDNDTQVKKDWLDNVTGYLDNHPHVGAGQLKLLRIGNNTFDSAGELITANGFLVERAREALDNGQFNKASQTFSGKGAAMIIRRKLFYKIGGFDRDYIYYWEEPDLMWRVWKAGFQVKFLWMGCVTHAYGSQAKPTPLIPESNQVYFACRNQILTIAKNAVGWHLWRMLFWVGLAWSGLLVLMLLKCQWNQAKSIVRAFGWLLSNIGLILRKRKWVQTNLKSSDSWIKQLFVKQGISWYAGKALAYISGRGF